MLSDSESNVMVGGFFIDTHSKESSKSRNPNLALDILHSSNVLFHTNAIIDDRRQGHTI